MLFRQTSQSRAFDPYEQVRGGTGYNFDFEQPTSRPPTSQPSMGRYQSPQMLNSYPYSQQMPHQGMPQGKENYLKPKTVTERRFISKIYCSKSHPNP